MLEFGKDDEDLDSESVTYVWIWVWKSSVDVGRAGISRNGLRDPRA